MNFTFIYFFATKMVMDLIIFSLRILDAFSVLCTVYYTREDRVRRERKSSHVERKKAKRERKWQARRMYLEKVNAVVSDVFDFLIFCLLFFDIEKMVIPGDDI